MFTSVLIYPRLSVEKDVKVPYDQKIKKHMRTIGGYYKQMFSHEYSILDTKYDDKHILVVLEGNLKDELEEIEQLVEQCNFIRINDKIMSIYGRVVEFNIFN